MKVGIITFHASHNYGSMLQAYAMSKILEKHGCTVEILNLRTEQQYNLYPYPLDLRVRTIRSVLADILFNPITIIGKWNKYEKFMRKYLPLTRVYRTLGELCHEQWDFDVLVVGSDQIWNTHCQDWNEAFFGNFINKSIKKVAYAPSMGRCPEETVDKKIVEKLCHGFSHISVREPRTADILRTIGIDQEIDITLDPTLLLDEYDYDGIYNKNKLIKGDYIYYYDPFRRPDFLRAASKIGKKMGMTVVVDRRYSPNETKGLDNLNYCVNVGPSEFLNLIKNASLVCGHSFHSVVFSILFRKDFLALDGDKDSRMMNILGQLGLSGRAVSMNDFMNFSNESITNYDLIHKKLDELREPSFQYLAKCGFPGFSDTAVQE